MGVARTVLALTLLGIGLLAMSPVRAAAAAPGPAVAVPARCLDCHAIHYAAHGGCVDCHRGDPRADRAVLAHHRLLRGAAATWALPGSPLPARAAALRDSLGCRRCHVSGGRGERLAIALDTVAWARTQDELRVALQRPAGAMPDFGLGSATADTLIAALLREADRRAASARYQVRFRAGSDDSLRLFVKRCGGCHQALTPEGPQGTGTAGPNLTGLLGPLYPCPPDSAWQRPRLEGWLANPRSRRAGTTMPPVSLESGELEAVLRALTPPPAAPPR